MIEKDKLLILCRSFDENKQETVNIINLIGNLSDYYRISVYVGKQSTRDKKSEPTVNKKILFGSDFYFSDNADETLLSELIGTINPDVLFILGLFDTPYVIPALRYAKDNKYANCVISADDDLLPTAMKVGGIRKKRFISSLNLKGLLKGIKIRTNSVHSAEVVRKYFKKQQIIVADDFCKPIAETVGITDKQSGKLRVVSAKRFQSIHNLDAIMESLVDVRGEVVLDIYGNIEDEANLNRMVKLALSFNPGITVNYKGFITITELKSLYNDYDVYFSPLSDDATAYVSEAFASGLPVITAEESLWKGITESKAGFNVSLNDKKGFAEAISYFAELNSVDYSVFRNCANYYIRKFYKIKENKLKFLKIFGYNLDEEADKTGENV